MNWKFSMLGVCLLVFQSEPAPPAAAREPAAVVVEVGHVPMQGVWYQDSFDHVHDSQVRLGHVYRKNGTLTVTLGTSRDGGTDLAFNFSHDATGSTRVGVTATYRHDEKNEGSPPGQRLRDVEGRVMLQTNDWGPEKNLTCVFALQGNLGKERQFLLGSFLVLIPKRG
jgi:hypothetical protein